VEFLIELVTVSLWIDAPIHGSYVYDTTHQQPVQIMTRRFAFDRKTAELVNCCGANINNNSGIKQSGVVGYVFPIGTQPRTYQVFDTTLNKPVPFRYDGTATVGGIKTYRFVEDVPPTRIGFSPLSSTQPEYYQIHLIYWVDPVTGALLNVNEDQKLFLRDPATGAQTTVLFEGDLQATLASVKEIVRLDSSGRDKLSLLSTTLPITIGIVGALALIGGILLVRRPRAEVVPAAASPEPADAAPAGT
jgi:Porin PorA